MLMTNLKKFPMLPKTYLGKFTMMVMTYLKMILMKTKTILRKFLMMVIIYLRAFLIMLKTCLRKLTMIKGCQVLSGVRWCQVSCCVRCRCCQVSDGVRRKVSGGVRW